MANTPHLNHSHAHVSLDGVVSDIDWPSEQPLLYAMQDAGLDPPFGCTEGECGACQLVVEGRNGATSHMIKNNVLDEYDIKDHIRLACQCLPDNPGETYNVYYLF